MTPDNPMKVNIENEYVRGYKDGKKEWKAKHDTIATVLQEFVSKHEAGLLPDRFVYDKAIKILNDGKLS